MGLKNFNEREFIRYFDYFTFIMGLITLYSFFVPYCNFLYLCKGWFHYYIVRFFIFEIGDCNNN